MALLRSWQVVATTHGVGLEGAGAEPKFDAYVASLREKIPGNVETIQTHARSIVERMALAL